MNVWYMYNISFCSYWIAMIFDALSIGIIWILSIQEKEHNDFFRLTLAFSLSNLASSVTTFLIYYYRLVSLDHTTPLWIMIVAHILGNGIFFIWVFFQSYIYTKEKKIYQISASAITIMIIVVFIIIAVTGMDRTYYIADDNHRLIMIMATLIDTIGVVLLLCFISSTCHNNILDLRCKRYIYIIGAALSINQILRFFVDTRDYGLTFVNMDTLTYLDPSGYSAMFSSIVTTIFVLTADFSPLFHKRTEDKGEQDELHGIEKLALLHNLTTRETEITELLCQGLTYVEISEQLHISINTVKRHIHNCYQKLDIKSRNELMFIVNRCE